MNDPDRRLRRRQHGRGRLRRQRLVVLTVVGLVLTAVIAAVGIALAEEGESSARQALEAPIPGSDRTMSTEQEQETTPSSRPALRPTTLNALRHVRGKVIVIDPGHNGRNYLHSHEINRQVNAGTLWKACDTTGTQTNDGYTEAEYNFDVAQRLAKILRRAGASVVLTRPNNRGWGPCITERAAIGNRARSDVAISLHADGAPASGRGFHIIYPPSIKGLTDDIARDSRRLAVALLTAFRATGMPRANYVGQNGLNVRSDLGGLNLSDVPKVLFETGNMRNHVDAALLKSSDFRQREAIAIAKGLDAFIARN